MSNKSFFSTARIDEHRINDVMISSCWNHASQNFGDCNLVYSEPIKLRSILSFTCAAFALIITVFAILRFWLVRRTFSSVRIFGVAVGRYAAAAAYRDIRSYNTRGVFFLRFAKSLTRVLIKFLEARRKASNSCAAFIDHGCYENGIYFEVFSKCKIPIYFNDYPYGLNCWLPSRAGGYDMAMEIPVSQANTEQKDQAIAQLEHRMTSTSGIPYLITDYSEFAEKIDYDVVIYTHSFTDAQNNFGYDGAFDNVLDWLQFTLDELIGRRVCIKAHPGIYVEGHSAQVVSWDRELFKKVVDKYSNDPNVTVLDRPIQNTVFLEHLNPDSIIVSHHSNALLEAGHRGFKCIASQMSTPWKGYKLFNEWADLDDYRRLLKKSFKELEPTDLSQLYSYVFVLYSQEGGFFREHWFQTLENVTGVSVKALMLDPTKLNAIGDLQRDEAVAVLSGNLVTRNR